jgi:hypothetical protein
MLQRDNTGALVATQSLVRELDLGLFFSDMEQLGAQLRDRDRLARIRENVWRCREQFTFDHHTDRLVGFFRDVISNSRHRSRAGK